MATVVAEKTGKTRIGRFIVQRLLGSGLQGAVYLAFDPDLERLVAVKILKPHNVSKHSPAMKLRPAEARIVARLAHPNVIPLYEMGLHQDIPYLVFAYVDGTTLGRRLKEHRILTVAEALWKGKPVIAGAVGGIPLQITHKHSGILTHSIEGTAHWIKQLLNDPDYARRLGINGREHIKNNYLITRHIKDYLLLFVALFYKDDVVHLQ